MKNLLILCILFSSIGYVQAQESDYVLMTDSTKVEGKLRKPGPRALRFRVDDNEIKDIRAEELLGYYSASKNLKYETRIDPDNGQAFFVIPILKNTAEYYLVSDGFVSNRGDHFRVLDAKNIRFFAAFEDQDLIEISKKKEWEIVEELMLSCNQFEFNYNSASDFPLHPGYNSVDRTALFDYYLSFIQLYNQSNCE